MATKVSALKVREECWIILLLEAKLLHILISRADSFLLSWYLSLSLGLYFFLETVNCKDLWVVKKLDLHQWLCPQISKCPRHKNSYASNHDLPDTAANYSTSHIPELAFKALHSVIQQTSTEGLLCTCSRAYIWGIPSHLGGERR